MSSPILLATRSEGKLRELRPLFADAGWHVIDLREAGVEPRADEDGIEVFETFEENALAKARYFHARAGMPAIADDSGLEVHALGGAPGVRTKRWSGRDDLEGQPLDDANNATMLAALEHTSDRRARYVCAAAWFDGRRSDVTRATTAGRLLYAPRGEGGFGYDPYFLSDELGVTFAEASTEDKSRISHRGRAFRALIGARRSPSDARAPSAPID